ncbi:DNA-directed RNA polymerase subunit omega [Alphaproteobacteria bacterium]
MARVTVEDCKDKASSRFELVELATHRAKELSIGTPPLIQSDSKKEAVIALREIAQGVINMSKLREEVISKYQIYRVQRHLPAHATTKGEGDCKIFDIDDDVSRLFYDIIQLEGTVKYKEGNVTKEHVVGGQNSDLDKKNDSKIEQMQKLYEDVATEN